MAIAEEFALLAEYLVQEAPILYFVLGIDGKICRMNRYAAKLMGEQVIGRAFQDVLLEYHQPFSLEQLRDKDRMQYLMNLTTQKGQTRSFHGSFWKMKDGILVLGHEDVDEIELLGQELLESNKELNNLMRELNAKNRELRRANATITELSRTDPLTQCSNRRYFDERLEELISMVRRQSRPLCLVMTDIDHFKKVNDRYGHDSGDRVLQKFSALLRQFTRTEDLVARFGGEEFVVLLPFTDLDQARAMSERIRLDLAEKDFLGNGYQVTASFGISQLRKEDQPLNLLRRADQALYQAKESGRNRTAVL